MKRAGVREFKDKAKDVDVARQAARELESILEGIISRRGLTREDLERAWKETA